MSIRIEVKATNFTERNVQIKNGSRAGQTAQFREQSAYAALTDRDGNLKAYPVEIKITLEDGAQPYPVGFYAISPASFKVDNFGGLALGRVKLVPLK